MQISVSVSILSGIERLRAQFFTIFYKTLCTAYGSEMWSARCLLFLRLTGSRHTIIEVCEFRIWQFRDCGGHIFPRNNANSGRFEVAFDRPEFDRTQQCLFFLFLLFLCYYFFSTILVNKMNI